MKKIIFSFFFFLLSISNAYSYISINIIGNYKSIQGISSNDNYILTNLNKGNEKTNSLFFENGIYYFNISPDIDLYNWYLDQNEMNQVFILYNNNLSNININLQDYFNNPSSHFYLSIGIENFPLKDYSMFEMELGGRFVISDSEKIKIGINRSIQIIFSDHLYTAYIKSTFGITLGYNIGIFKPSMFKEYLFSWFSDFSLKIPDSFSFPYRLDFKTGINIILCPLISLNIGIEINLFLPQLGIPIPFIFKSFSSTPPLYSSMIDFCLYASYEIFFPVKNEQKVKYIY